MSLVSIIFLGASEQNSRLLDLQAYIAMGRVDSSSIPDKAENVSPLLVKS
jgi:hypothetical protein